MNLMISSQLAVAVILSAAVVAGKPYGDDNNDLYSNDDYEDPQSDNDNHKEEKVILMTPSFITEQSSIMVNEGGTIKLPCIVDRLEGFVLLWKRGEDIIAVGKQVITKDDGRVKLIPDENKNGNTLVISLAEESDAGDYKCQVSAYKPTELKHTVRIRVKPEVRPVPQNGLIVAKTGDSVTLACEITRGSPTPEVIWRRNERKMPSGEDSIRGLSITYTAVTRHHSGHYICSADNGFGDESSTTDLKLDVQHAPEVEQEETFIHTGTGDETEVICIVHSSPRAQVTWYKDDVLLDESDYVMNERGNRHTLLISNIDETKFGYYTCKAKNEFGEDQKTTEVSGRAGEAVIKSNPKGMAYNQFTLEWTAESYTPISSFKIRYQPLGSSSISSVRSSSEGWKEIEIPATHLDREYYSATYTIPTLEPATVYVVQLSSKNDYGYNDYGEPFKFATRGADPIQKPITGNGSMPIYVNSVLFIVLGFFYLL